MNRTFRLIVSLIVVLNLLGSARILAQAPPPLPSGDTLNYWPFDDTTWTSSMGDLPLSFTNIDNPTSWDGNALQVDSTNAAWLQLSWTDYDGWTNITCNNGTIYFWFKPNWSSTNQGGTGPGDWGRLIDIGAWTSNATYGWWSLYLNPAGTQIYFSGQTNGLGTDYLSASISWDSNTWHLIDLTYTPTNSILYLDGHAVTNGSGVTYRPSPAVMANGFYVGSDYTGLAQAHGQFENLWTLSYILDARSISNYYGAVFPSLPVDLNGGSSGMAALSGSPPSFDGAIDGTNGSSAGASSPSIAQGYDTNAFWLEILRLGTNAFNADTNSATLIIHGTVPDIAYQILSKHSLTDAVWTVEQNLIGNVSTNWTPTTISMIGRPTMFFRAIAYGQDTDGDGLPDWWETQYGLDPNNPDTGGTGVPDGYKMDSAGDGWNNLQKFQMGIPPGTWATPPAPTGFNATFVSGTNASLSWNSSLGNVIGYTVERQDPWGYSTTITNTLSASQTSFTDANYSSVLASMPNGDEVQYRVCALYSNGGSVTASLFIDWQDPAIDPSYTVTTHIGRGSDGSPYLLASGIPANITTLRIHAKLYLGDAEYPSAENYNYLWQELQSYAPVFNLVLAVPVTSITNGIYRFTATDLPPFAAADFHTEAIGSDGKRGYLYPDSTYGDNTSNGNGEWIPYLAGTTQIQQNVSFLLRSAIADQALTLYTTRGAYAYLYPAHNDYVFAGFHTYSFWSDHLGLNEFQPFEENWFYRNFVFDPSAVNSDGGFLTGVTGNTYEFGLDNPAYLFPTYSYVVNSNQAPIAPVLPANTAAKWIYFGGMGSFDLTQIGLISNGQPSQAVVGTGYQNHFGLSLKSVKFFSTNSGTFLTGFAGDTISTNEAAFFMEMDQPVLSTVAYYFARPYTDPLPGEDAFSVTNTTPRLIASASEPFSITAWAKQSISNGYTGKFAYPEQYFDKAYKIGTNGVATTNTTGILSPYGEFFPTEPGPTALVTLPDGATSQRGTGIVNVIKMQLDANHDGVMDTTFAGPDNTSAANPFRFWINSDCDVAGYPLDSDVNNPEDPDYQSLVIRSKRDLEDFARLWIVGLPSLPAGNGYQVTLSWTNVTRGNPIIKLCRSAEADGGTGYLTDMDIAAMQSASSMYGTNNRSLIIGTVAPGQQFTFPANYFSDNVTKYFLFEGAGFQPITSTVYNNEGGAGELVLTIAQNGTNIASTSVFMDLKDVKDMIERVHIENAPTSPPSTTLADQSSYKEDNYLPTASGDGKNIIVLVHGWRVSAWTAENFAETMFKRLWWQGYQGRFVALRWPTLSGETDGPIVQYLTFNRDEYIAFKCAQGAANYFLHLQSRFPDYSINACAHSHGNVLMTEVLKRHLAGGQKPIKNFALLQAAVAAECLDTNAPLYPAFVLERGSLPDSFYNYAGPIENAIYGHMVNFYNTNDFGVVTCWEPDQILTKPDNRYGYQYILGTPYKSSIGSSRVISDQQELMAFLSRPTTQAVGAVPGLGGPLNTANQVDLQALVGFTGNWKEHSGEFNWPIQQLRPFYQELLDQLQ